MRNLTEPQELRKRVLGSIVDILVLQSINEQPMPKNELVQKLNSKFDASLNYHSVYSVLSFLQNKGLILNGPSKVLMLTEKGEQARKGLLKDYLDLQKLIVSHLH